MSSTTPAVFAAGDFGHEEFQFRLSSDDQQMSAYLSRLLSGLRIRTLAGVTRDLTVTSQPPDGVAIKLDGEIVACSPDAVGAVEAIIHLLDRWVVDASPSRLHIHGGCVSREGEAVLVVGASGDGKSTLVTELARGGYSYLTDEIVSVKPADGSVTGLLRPIVLKPGRDHHFGELLERVEVEGTGGPRYIAPDRLPSGTRQHPAPVKVIVLCRRHERFYKGRLRHIPAAMMAARLVRYCFDATRRPFDFLEILARLTAGAHCVVAEYVEAETLTPLIEDVHARESPDLEVRTVPAPPAAEHVRRAPEVTSLVVGDGVVAAHATTGEVLGITGSAAAVWDRLDGRTPMQDLIVELAHRFAADRFTVQRDVLALIQDLSRMGFVVR